MTDDEQHYFFVDQDNAELFGFDLQHAVDHLAETALCLLDGDVEMLDVGVFISFVDQDNRTWTFSVIPEDGGAISKALLDVDMGDQL